MEELQACLIEQGLTVSSLPEKGRCLFTTKHFYPGQVIIREEPYVCVPNTSSSKQPRCDHCFSSTNLKKCSACHVVFYCGASCQKLEWKVHQLECKMLSRLDTDKRNAITPSIRLMLKLYIRRKLQYEKIISSNVKDNYSLVEALVSHMSKLDEKRLVLYAQMANLVNLILQWPDINLKEIAENFSKLSCNAHTICDNELRPLGTGLFPIISITNHSCLPNAVLVFEGRVAVLRAVQHIPKDSEVLISYIETAGSTETRLEALKEQYLFACSCLRCAKLGQPDDIKEGAILEGYRCEDDRCSGFLLHDPEANGFRCQTCGRIRDKQELKQTTIKIKTLTEKASAFVSFGQLEEAISTYKMAEKLQARVCHFFSISLLQTREKLLKMLMELEEWKEALDYCRLTIPAYERVYMGFHPLLGLQYYTRGKLEWLLRDTENAIQSLTKAVDMLQVTHGTNTPFMKELMMKLEEAHAEASYQISCKED